MTHIVIITAKGGNQTVQDKNVREIAGKPCLAYPIEAGQHSRLVDRVFVSTEDDKIREVSVTWGAEIIDRPAELAQPFTNHGDAIIHAAKSAAERVDELQTVTILLGNTVMVDGVAIDAAIERTIQDDNTDSCMTVWKAQDDHPFRALVVDEEGFLRPFLDQEAPDTNRQSYPDVYFYDQGPWTVRYESLLRSEQTREGPGPWWWMGRNSTMIERIWVTGRDTHTEFDLSIAEWWLRVGRFLQS